MHDDGKSSDGDISNEYVVEAFGSCILIGKKDAHLVTNEEFKSVVYFKTREGKYDECC